jgi:hypothetical protein
VLLELLDHLALGPIAVYAEPRRRCNPGQADAYPPHQRGGHRAPVPGPLPATALGDVQLATPQGAGAR